MENAAEPLRITLDIAAVVSAIIWPLILLIMLFLLRDRIPALARELASRVTKIDIAGVTLELAKAKAFTPDFATATAGIDLRSRANAVQVNDSTAATFLSQLRDPGSADFAIVNLGSGDEWLTSRLYIMAVVFARMKGVRAFVFIGHSSMGRQYLGWAEPAKIRWALARKYPWLEAAYASAYSETTSGANGTSIVTSATGRLGLSFDPTDPQPSVDLLRAFLQGIQWPHDSAAGPAIAPPRTPPAPDAEDWVSIDDATGAREHAVWLTSSSLEEILEGDLDFSHVSHEALQGKNRRDQIRLVLAETGVFVAVTRADRRFDYLVDRSRLLDEVGRALLVDV